MDLLDFTDCALYFEAELSPEVEQLMHRAAECYGEPEAELALLRAFLHAPDSLTVLVGLYRYYFYQHRLAEALDVAYRAMRLASARLGISDDWRRLDEHGLAVAAAQSFGLLRFYLLALKAAGVVLLRLGGFFRRHIGGVAAQVVVKALQDVQAVHLHHRRGVGHAEVIQKILGAGEFVQCFQ